jgi:hypothetical protein
MAGERHGNGMACVNQTRLHYVNQMGKTQSKILAERHGRGTAGAQQGNGRVTAWDQHGKFCKAKINISVKPLFKKHFVKFFFFFFL